MNESNREKIAILTDSGCDVPNHLIEKYHMKVLSLKIIYKDHIYSDGIDIEAEEVYKGFAREIPKTSTPNIQEVNDAVASLKEEGYEKIIAICISTGLSGTCNTVTTALREVTDMETYVFDTKNISFGAGVFAVWVGEKIEEGLGFSEITEALAKKAQDSKIFYYMDTLDYLKAGGRIGNVTGVVGKILDLKPIISCNDKGIYYTVAMTRGKKNGIKKLLSLVEENSNQKELWFTLLNGRAAEVAAGMKPELMELCKKGRLIVERQINASLAIHTGPGLIGVGVFEAGIS